MKVRSMLSATEISRLQEHLDERLERIGMASQPEVVLKLLGLASKPDAQINEYARIIKTDHAVSGRVLRLANSAFFAQRTPVSTLERACLVLGLERLKSVTLGFHLSRAASGSGEQVLSREIWGQSVLRACIAGEIARVIAPAHVPEAFVVGLMMDAGIPLMPKIAGPSYLRLLDNRPGPGRLYRLENESVPFTHVDVMSAMARKWKLPELLARPIELHHTRPAEPRRDDPLGRLHRVAYVVGLLEFPSGSARTAISAQSPGMCLSSTMLGIQPPDLGPIVARSVSEYSATVGMFSDIAASLDDSGESLGERVERELVSAVDLRIEESLGREQAQHAGRVVVGGQTVELVRESDGGVVAVLYDARGQQLLTHRFTQGAVSPAAVADALGLDVSGDGDSKRLADYLVAKAA